MIGLHAPILFPVVFGIVDLIMFWGLLQIWFKSVTITVNSTNVRVKKHWLIFSRTRDFSAGDYTRFTTKMGMQSGSTIYTDIRLVRAGADAEFAPGLKRFQDPQPVNQLVAERFRQAAGPSGVTVASSLANSAEAEWLVSEMNSAFGQAQSRPVNSAYEMVERPELVSAPVKPPKAFLVAVMVLVLAGSFGYDLWRHVFSISAKPAPVKSTATNLIQPPPQPVLDVAFSSCDPSEAPQKNGYLFKAEGHADWFVCKTSGHLRTIEMKIEPVEQGGGKLLLSFSEDHGGFPGSVLEAFSIPNPASTNSAGWVVLNSRKQPALAAGTKYWLCVKSSGAWLWHFGRQNLVQTTMYTPHPHVWAAAGITNVCAFSILEETNLTSSRQ